MIMDAFDQTMSKSPDISYLSDDSPDISYDVPNHQNSEFLDNFLMFDDWMNDDQAPIVPEYQDPTQVYVSTTIDEGSQYIASSSISNHLQGDSICDTGIEQARRGTKQKVAFKTQSQIENLNDGFKWRKYGKKMVKNSPNPRNYYRCSAEGCSVKKRVERDVDDARFVITTYEGVHNHQRPSNF